MRSRQEPTLLEQCTEVQRNVSKCGDRASAGASAGHEGIKSTLPADLQTSMDAWGSLDDALKAGIVAMVKASKTV